MSRKVIIDTDPGIDDAVALCLALFDPRLDVVALTAVEGNVPCQQATRNVQAIIEQLDPPRWPRIGAASSPMGGKPVDSRHINGTDGLGNSNFQVAELHHVHPAEKVICDEIRAAPDQVTIIAMGPLTNIANAFQRDPNLPAMVGQLVITGGAISAAGNVTPAAEFNIHCDPEAAKAVFHARCTKTLVPLDVTDRVQMTLDLFDQLPAESTRAGRLLHKVLPFAFRSYRQQFGLEEIRLHDAVAVAAVLHPELFETQPLAGDVETQGDLTLGATIFDRRPRPEWRPNMDVAVGIDAVAAIDCIMRGLAEAGRAG